MRYVSEKSGYTPVLAKRVTGALLLKKYDGYEVMRVANDEHIFCCKDYPNENEWVESLETLQAHCELVYNFSKDSMLLMMPFHEKKFHAPFCVMRKDEPFFFGAPGDKILVYFSGALYLTRIMAYVHGNPPHFITNTFSLHINTTQENIFHILT